jgi:hypothetical protein
MWRSNHGGTLAGIVVRWRLIEAEVQRVDRAAYEQALREESKAAARYFEERLERSQYLVEAFENPPPKKGKADMSRTWHGPCCGWASRASRHRKPGAGRWVN